MFQFSPGAGTECHVKFTGLIQMCGGAMPTVPVLVGEEARLLKFTGAQLNFVSNNSTWLVRVVVPAR